MADPNDSDAADATETDVAEGTPGYAEALGELDAILHELDSSDVDVDHLAERVARAAALIAICREKISTAQVSIEQVTAELDG